MAMPSARKSSPAQRELLQDSYELGIGMSGNKTGELSCRLYPDGQDAGVFAVRSFDSALNGELLAMPCGLDPGDGLACSMSP